MLWTLIDDHVVLKHAPLLGSLLQRQSEPLHVNRHPSSTYMCKAPHAHTN